MRTVRTTIQPHKVLQVSEQEYTDLHRQGLLIEDQPAPAPDSPAAKPRAQALTKKEN